MKTTRPNQAAAALLLCQLLAGCAAGPDYRRPAVPVPPAFAEIGSTARTTLSAEDADISRWWIRFGDPVLDRLIERALSGSLTLQAAAARIDQARFDTLAARAAANPSISATGAAVHYGSNASPGGTGTLNLPTNLDLYSAGFDASWEIDVFGARRRAVEEASANEEAARWARRDAEVSLSAEIANVYFGLRGTQARLELARTDLERQDALLAVVRARRSAGYVTQLDVHRQAGLTEGTRAAIPLLEADASADIHALAVLLGEAPEALSVQLLSFGRLPPPPPALPLGLPSQLLERRPDLRTAERRLAASTAQLGAQVARGYPKFNLLGLASFAGASLEHLLSSGNLMAAGLGLVSVPVFDAGRNSAAVGSAESQRAQAELAYREAILIALQDVEDALARLQAQERRRTALLATVADLQASLTITEDQYRSGTLGFADVLEAEGAALNAKDALVTGNALALTRLVAVYKALGGGWQPEP